jgi:hypothetical protein
LSLFFNFALECAIWNVQGNKEGMKLNGTHEILVSSDDVNILCENIYTIKEIAEALLEASRERLV